MGIEVLIVLFNVTLYLMVQAFSMMFFYEGIFEDGVGRPPPAVLTIYYYYGAFQLLYVAANVMYYRHYTLPQCSRTTDIEVRYEAEILLMSDYTIGFSTSGYLIAVLSYGLSMWLIYLFFILAWGSWKYRSLDRRCNRHTRGGPLIPTHASPLRTLWQYALHVHCHTA